MKPEHHDPVYQSILSQFQKGSCEDGLAERLDIEQMFILINGVLPVEACLYYQVLPLFLDGSRLHLGMVSLNDASAADYVRRIISYLNYSLVPHSISSESLQAVLSAYLKSCNQPRSATAAPPASDQERTPRLRRNRTASSLDRNTQPTLIVDSPEVLASVDFGNRADNHSPLPDPPPQFPANPAPIQEEASPHPPAAIQPQPPDDSAPTFHLDSTDLTEVTDFSKPLASPWETESPDELDPFAPPPTHSPGSSSQGSPPPEKLSVMNPLPELEIRPNYLSDPIKAIATLPPAELLQELFGRALIGGIGRLYFERQQHQGRVLWSQNGVLQSVLDQVALPTFQGLLGELKRMTKQSLIAVEKPKHVDLERMYDHNRILLRFRFMPSDYGEEATVQVLRGAALRFYQQQQFTSLSRDALSIAKQLQTKVYELRDRARSDPHLAKAKADTLPALYELLHNIEKQLDSLQISDSQLDGDNKSE